MSNLSKFSFTVNRATWRCGDYGINQKGLGVTKLRNQLGYQCCLGFACIAIGFDELDIEGYNTPFGFGEITNNNRDLSYLVTEQQLNSDFTNAAMDINDDDLINDKEREQRLIALGRMHNIEINFIGEYEQDNVSAKTPRME